MNYKKFTGVITVFIITCLFWSVFFAFGTQSLARAEEISQFQDIAQQEEQGDVYYKLHKAEYGQSIPATVYIKGQEVITINQIAGGLTPRERAAILVDRLKTFIDNCEDPQRIFPEFKNGLAIIEYDDKPLITADEKSAKAMGMTVSSLAFEWANCIRRALGGDNLVRDHNLLKMLFQKNDNVIGYDEVGIASWYGGYFHGRRAADGSRYDMNLYTAAHKTLPFGSIVKVTNLKNGSSCIVKITDRGPFVKGRIIDLSRVAAKEIGMLGSGVSKVKIEVIGKV